MKKELTTPDETTEFLLYTSPSGEIKVEVFFQNENIWLTQKRMAELFEVSIPTVNEHLKNIFNSGELSENSVIRNFLITASDGKKYSTNFYNLDAIISVGYRVNSARATKPKKSEPPLLVLINKQKHHRFDLNRELSSPFL